MSNVSPHGGLSQVSPPKYEKPQEKFFRKAHASLNAGREIQKENHYNLRNYRLDNKKLPVGLPGEQRAMFYEKSFEEREKIDNQNLQKYVEDIYREEGSLQNAIQQSYNQASKLSKGAITSPSAARQASNFETVKSLLVQTAQDQIALSQRMISPSNDAAVLKLVAQVDSARKNHA